MNTLLDAGALMAVDRDDREVIIAVEIARRSAGRLMTIAPVVGQAWRGGPKQARLARLIGGVDVRPSTLQEAKDAGELLAAAGTSDVVDAMLVGLALPGDQIFTSDPDDIGRLIDARGLPITVVRI